MAYQIEAIPMTLSHFHSFTTASLLKWYFS